MTILTILAVGALCIVCFFVGAKVGQKVSKGEDIKMPSVNPMTMIKEHNAKREAEREQDRLETILHNIESYDGTGAGQKDVPRG